MKNNEIVTQISGISQVFIIFILFGISSTAADSTSNDTTSTSWADTFTDRLKRDLLVNYDKYSKPTGDVEIVTGLAIKHIDVDEVRGVFSVYGWIRFHWKDNKLAWEPKEYGNLSSIDFAGHEIWEPEIVAFNGISSNTIDSYGDTLILAYNDGSLLRVPPVHFEVFCDLNFRHWPYDTQKCQLKLGSWNSRDIKVKIRDDYSEIERLVMNNEWSIKNFSTGTGSDPDYKTEYVTFDFLIERKSPMYRAIIITPASCIVLMVLASFWLPPQCGEKILLNGINALLITGFLMYFAQLLPVLAENTPLVVLFFSSSLVLVSISMVISVVVLYLASGKHSRRIPQCLKNLLNGSLGVIFCLSNLNTDSGSEQNNKEMQENHQQETIEEQQIIDLSPSPSPKKSIQHDWILLAVAIDRFFFLIYCLVFIVLAVSYSV